jgi:hypothetical protein
LRVREKELAGLTDAEAQQLEALYAAAFEPGPSETAASSASEPRI